MSKNETDRDETFEPKNQDTFSVNPQQLVRVFISSKCGDGGPFTKIRKDLAIKIEETGVFSAYIWERGGAATTTAEENYRMELRDSDVCVFILDNSVDVPEGVLNEIEEARLSGKKCMYYFCVENGKKQLPLQEELRGPKGPTYTIVQHLSDIPSQVVRDLQEDILRIYRGWCNNFIASQENIETISLSSSVKPFSVSLRKDDLGQLKATSAFFANFLLNAKVEEHPAGKLDAALLSFAKSMYVDFNVAQFDYTELSEAIQEILPKQYTDLISGRWEVIRLYFSNNAKSAVKKLEELLEISENSQLDKWFIDDILIDLRNISFEVEDLLVKNRFQRQLEEDPSSVVYPQIDREETNFYEKINDDNYKEITRSMGTVIIGDNATRFLEEITRIFAISVCFGSLTHISRVVKHMRSALSYLSSKYSSINLNTAFVKLAIVSGKQGDGESVLQTFTTTQFDCDEKSAMDLFEFCAGYKGLNSSLITVFESFKIIGCYLNESDFFKAQAVFVQAVEKELKSEDPWKPKSKSIFGAISSNIDRLSVGWIVSICEKAIKSKRRFWIIQALRFIALNGKELLEKSASNQKRLINAIGVLLNDNATDLFYSESACVALVALSKVVSSDLKKSINRITDLLSEELKVKYKLFSEEEAPDRSLILLTEQQIDLLESANRTQGIGGAFSFGEDHAGLFAAYISQMKSFDSGLVRRGFNALISCLQSGNQDCDSKYNAVRAIESLMMKFDIADMDPNKSLEFLLDSPEVYLSAKYLGGKVSAFLLDVHMNAISAAIGKTNGEDLILSLAKCYGEDLYTRANAGEALRLIFCSKIAGDLPSEVLSAAFSYASFMARSAHFQLNYRGLELMSDCLKSKLLRDMAAEILKMSYIGQVPRCKYTIIDSLPVIHSFSPDLASEIEGMVRRDNAVVFAKRLDKIKSW